MNTFFKISEVSLAHYIQIKQTRKQLHCRKLEHVNNKLNLLISLQLSLN